MPRRSTNTCKEVLSKNGSDLHFIAGDPPRIRLYGDLQPLRPSASTEEFVQDDALRDHAADRASSASKSTTAPTSPTPSGESRASASTCMRHLNGLGAVFRAIPSKALTLEQLNMPKAVRSLCRANNGLILVTGKTGSGKSTTLAAMIDDINARDEGPHPHDRGPDRVRAPAQATA